MRLEQLDYHLRVVLVLGEKMKLLAYTSALIFISSISNADDLSSNPINLSEYLDFDIGSNSFNLKPNFENLMNTSEFNMGLSDGNWAPFVERLSEVNKNAVGGVNLLADYISDHNQSLYNDPLSNSFNPIFDVAGLSLASEMYTAPSQDTQTNSQIFSQGTIFTESFIGSLENSQQLGIELQNPNATLDLQALGLARPNSPLDAYALFDSNNNFTGLITAPAGRGLNLEQKTALADADSWLQKTPSWGEKIYSSVDHILALTVERVCNSKIRPEEFTVNVSGSGNLVFAELGIDITAKFNSNDVCAHFSADDIE
ncbi:MAG: hypothetical protein P8L32_05265 [Paracoccaceae bacterium]|nr:hypothetical protein [Paracoccaceae bacterium]